MLITNSNRLSNHKKLIESSSPLESRCYKKCEVVAVTTSPHTYKADPLIDCLNKQFSLSSWESAIERFHFSMSEHSLWSAGFIYLLCWVFKLCAWQKPEKWEFIEILQYLVYLIWQVSTRCSSYRIIRNEYTHTWLSIYFIAYQFLSMFQQPLSI